MVVGDALPDATPARTPPDDCQDMAALRRAIDDLDTQLFALFGERMRYIHRAAELKRGAGIPADVPKRVEEVVANARRRASQHGLDPDLYGRFWREIVRSAIVEEERRLGDDA